MGSENSQGKSLRWPLWNKEEELDEDTILGVSS